MADEPPRIVESRLVGTAAPDTFPIVRDLALAFIRHLAILDVEILEAAIAQGEAALSATGSLEALTGDGAPAIKARKELEAQLALIRGCLDLRRTIENLEL